VNPNQQVATPAGMPRTGLLGKDLDEHPLPPPAGELPVKDLLPGAEVRLAFGDGDSLYNAPYSQTKPADARLAVHPVRIKGNALESHRSSLREIAENATPRCRFGPPTPRQGGGLSTSANPQLVPAGFASKR